MKLVIICAVVAIVIVSLISLNGLDKSCRKDYGQNYHLTVNGSQMLCVSSSGEVKATR